MEHPAPDGNVGVAWRAQFLLVGEDDTMPATNKEGTTILDRHFATPPAITAHAALDAETGAYSAALMAVLSPAMTARARAAIRRWPGYAPTPLQIGRASGRGSVCQYVSITVVAVSFKQNKDQIKGIAK